MKNATLILILFSLMTSMAWAGNKAAIVKIMKGEAYVVSGKGKLKLKVNDWIEAGSTVKTLAKSFLKVVFIDKSQMNIGPSSEVKIERFHQKDAGVIGLVRGKIRSQVSKDYLQIDDKNRSKLFIKTKNAVMGIRGTDFLISTTGKNTVAILFEGSVVFNKLSDQKLMDSAKLDDVVDRGVRLFPGEFSAVGENGQPTIPALLNVQQREKLEKNVTFDKNSKSVAKTQRSIVPAGLSGSVVSSKPSINIPTKDDGVARVSDNPDSYTKDGRVKPANGSFVMIDAAKIIQPGSDSILDESTNTYIASSSSGDVKLDGTFIPDPNRDMKTDINIGGATNVDTTAFSGNTTARDPVATNIEVPLPNITPPEPTGNTVQVGETLNDVVRNVPVVGPTAGTVTQPVGDIVDGTVSGVADTTSGVVSGATDAVSGTAGEVKDRLGNLLKR